MTGNLKQTGRRSRMHFAVSKPQDGSWSARPDGRRLATASDGRTVRSWDATPVSRSSSSARGAAPKCTRTRLLAVERSEAAKTRTRGDRRSLFDRFVQMAHRRVSQAPFFFVCAGIVAVWLASLPLWEDLKEWQTAIHTVASVLTLLLVVLLENASRRAEEAAQEKLNVIAEGLAELMTSEARTDPDLREAAKRLRETVALEKRH